MNLRNAFAPAATLVVISAATGTFFQTQAEKDFPELAAGLRYRVNRDCVDEKIYQAIHRDPNLDLSKSVVTDAEFAECKQEAEKAVNSRGMIPLSPFVNYGAGTVVGLVVAACVAFVPRKGKRFSGPSMF